MLGIIPSLSISYRDAKCVPEADLDAAIAASLIHVLEPASDELLDKILEGAAATDEIPGKAYRLLQQQGLVG